MSRKYYPDRWAIIEITDNSTGETTKRVLASWYGGWAGSDSWKISSAINEIQSEGHMYEFFNESGSIYICHKQEYGVSNYTASVFAAMINESEMPGSPVSLKYIDDFCG